LADAASDLVDAGESVPCVLEPVLSSVAGGWLAVEGAARLPGRAGDEAEVPPSTRALVALHVRTVEAPLPLPLAALAPHGMRLVQR